MWASEIEPFPIEVTRLRFPEMCHVGDITKLNGEELAPVDLVCGGSPCQDLSVAGKRAGLQGERSGLFMEQVRVIKEMRAYDKANGRSADAVRPRYMCWENVPGAFSSSGSEDFRAVLEETCRIADSSVSVPRPPGGVWKSAGTILGHQFSIAWRVYDAQYWPRTPQRRKRIYLVADFGGHTAPKILFKQDSLFGDSQTSGETRQGAAVCSQESIGNPGGSHGECLTPWDVQSRRIYESDGVWPSLYGGEGGGHGNVTAEKENETVPINRQSSISHNCLGENTGFGIREQDNSAITLQAAAKAHDEYTFTAFACNQRDEVRDLNNVAGAIQAQSGIKQQTFIAESSEITTFHINQRDEFVDLNGISGALLATRNMQMQTFISEPITGFNIQSGDSVEDVSHGSAYCIAGNIIDRQDHNGGNGLGVQPDISYTVTSTDRHCVFSQQRSDEYAQNEVVSTQSARQYKDATDLVCEADVAGLDCRNGTENGDLSGTLQSKTNGGYSLNNVNPIRVGKLIRRLTPLECERLQGYPDFWTDIPGASDSARYKALGNSVAIPCVEHVLRGIAYFLRKFNREQEESICTFTPIT
ncbi:hypothetical protein LAD12857_15660 [Lacrimispora amygdalina]|uniref:DNA (cytosine-5-)-methyltransferase n=1 Tax=Lacrimispora amygdalina TaxID=253257 RepID=A0ABQ5M3W8_9FIRM